MPISSRRSGDRRPQGSQPESAAGALSAERDRTQAWLHDHTLQLLEFIAAGAYDDEVTAERLRNVAALAADELREYLEGTGAGPTSDLPTALRREIADAQVVAGALTIELDCQDGIAHIEPEHVSSLAAAMREALTNVRKHARATRVLVTCAPTSSGAVVTIADDGVGFDPSQTRTGLGLRRSVVGRMLACGGSARVVSHPGHGTLVVLTAGSPPPRPLPRELAA